MPIEATGRDEVLWVVFARYFSSMWIGTLAVWRPNPQRRSVECGADRRVVSRKKCFHAQLVLFLVENQKGIP